MEPSRPDLTISIISADNLALLLPCLRSVFASTHRLTLEVFVVDNASTDGTAEAVAAEFPQVKVIRNTRRLGFSTNNNLVLRQGQGRYLMLLNDDTVVLDGALDIMVTFLDEHGRAGAAGARLLNPDNTRQLSTSRFPHPLWEAFAPARDHYGELTREDTRPLEVDCTSGAALMVRRQVVEQVGVLDTAFDPIYSEEIDWCYRIKQAGWQIYSVPTARIIHYGGQTMNRVVFEKYRLLLAHKALFFQKHNGNVAAMVYRVALALATVVKLGLWLVRGLMGKGNAEKLELHWYLLRRFFSI